MGKSNAKRVAQCETATPHPQHVWIQDYQEGGRINKFFCRGVEAPTHIHIWDATPRGQVICSTGGFGGVGSGPWNGPFECSCGMSRWLVDGVAEAERFPRADPHERTRALKAKLDRGETLSDRDIAELQAIGEALQAAIAPLVEAFSAMMQQMGEYITSFLDKVDPKLMAELVEMSKAFSGETGDEVNVIEIMGSDGVLIDTMLLTPTPAAAVNAISLQEDHEPVVTSNSGNDHLPGVSSDGTYTLDFTDIVPKLYGNVHLHIDPEIRNDHSSGLSPEDGAVSAWDRLRQRRSTMFGRDLLGND